MSGMILHERERTMILAAGAQGPAGAGGQGAPHADLTGRDSADQHPIAAVTGLQSALDAKQAASATLTTLSSATAAGLALMDDADAAAQRTTLGLGSAATQASSAFEAAGAVAAHAGATDPHGDRAYADSLAANYATAAQGALADSAVQDVGAEIHAAAEKTTPVDADKLGLVDSAAAWALKYLTWANLKAALKTYFDGLYAAVSHAHNASAIDAGTLDAARLPTQATATWEDGVGTDESAVSPAKVAAAIAALGGGGSGERRYDESGNFQYIGQAPAGSAEGSNVWTIRRLTYSSGGYVETLEATAVSWTGRAGHSYA